MEIVIIRGLARWSKHWGDFPKYLKSVKAIKKVIAPDNIGTGEHYLEPASTQIKDYVDHIRNSLPKTKKERLVLGVSLGGMIATHWAYHYPEELKGLITVNTSYGKLSHSLKRLRPKAALEFSKIATSTSTLKTEKGILRLVSNKDSSEQETLLGGWMDATKQTPMKFQNIAKQLIAAKTFKGFNVPCPIPMLVVASRGDRLCHWECSESIAQHCGATFRIHETSGHEIPLDEPEWLSSVITDWIEK